MVVREDDIYWVYELPNWLFGTLTIAITEAIGLGGLYATRKWVRRIHGTEHSHNEVVGFYLSAICVFYGITLALLAVGTWQIYSDVDSRRGRRLQSVREGLPGPLCRLTD
jgi:ABC-type branched-subunit amino acid transport system permease subunit